MATAISEIYSAGKAFKYLDPFVDVLREGKDVFFDKENTPTRRVYKDGERVKKIIKAFDAFVKWGLDVYDKSIIEDIFADEDFDAKRSNPNWREIEFQNIADGKVEVHRLSKIQKATISTHAKKSTNFSGKTSDWTETLTCYALALRQDKGSAITEDEFRQFLMDGRNGNTKVKSIINQNVVTTLNTDLVFQFGLEESEWITSGTNVANALYASPYLKNGIAYDFFFAGANEIEWFKSKWTNKFNLVLAKYLRSSNNIADDVPRYGTTNADKWNPADIFAVSKNLKRFQEGPQASMGFFKGTLAEYRKFKKKNVSVSDEKVKQDMAELTRYNSWIHENVLNGTLIPISLKKALKTTKVDLISNPSIDDYSIEVKNIRVSWEKTAQKIYIYFTVEYTMSVAGSKKKTTKSYSYFFDCRNFGPSTGVQFELGIDGSSAKQGKVAAGPAAMIIDMTSPAIYNKMKEVRKKFLENNNFPEKLAKEFTSRIINKSRQKFFTDNEDINAIVKHSGWIDLFSSYIETLSGEIGFGIDSNPQKSLTYFKSKIGPVELGWIMTSNQIQATIKNNVLKSLYLYAGSQGLQIFDDSGLLKASYFYNSSYVKVRD